MRFIGQMPHRVRRRFALYPYKPRAMSRCGGGEQSSASRRNQFVQPYLNGSTAARSGYAYRANVPACIC